MALESFSFTARSGTKLHYLQSGKADGPLLIALHGLGGSTSTFQQLLPSIPNNYRTVLVDFPGHGKSPLIASEKPLSIKSHVSDLGNLITYLQAGGGEPSKGKIIILGHSIGSIVALHYAARAPENVAGLVLFAAGQSASHIPFVRQRMLDLAAETRKQGIEYAADLAAKSNFPSDEQRTIDPAHREAVRKAVAGSDPEGYAQTCEAIVSDGHIDPDYSKIVCPAVLIAGDLDVIHAVVKSNNVSEQLGGDSWVEVVKSGHQPILEDTESTTAAMLKLLAKISN